MNTSTELDEIDLLLRQRISAEEMKPWHGALTDITTRGRQLRRRRTARLCGLGAAAVGVITAGIFASSPLHNPLEDTLANEPSPVPTADHGWAATSLAPEEAEHSQIAQACSVIGDLEAGPAQALAQGEPVAVSRYDQVATAIYVDADNLGLCNPDFVRGRWRGQADGSFIIRPIARPSAISPAAPATVEFVQTQFDLSEDGSTTSSRSLTFGWARPEVDRIQISVGEQRHEAFVKDGFYFVELPPAHEGYDAVEKATADGTFTIAELRDATLTAYDANGAELGTIPFQVG